MHRQLQFEGDAPMTYWELNKRANAVARQLVCGRGTYVPVCVSRSVNLVITILAILKTGAAYVLLSDDTPLERNRFIMKDIQAPFIITDITTRGSFLRKRTSKTWLLKSMYMIAVILTHIRSRRTSCMSCTLVYVPGAFQEERRARNLHSTADP